MLVGETEREQHEQNQTTKHGGPLLFLGRKIARRPTPPGPPHRRDNLASPRPPRIIGTWTVRGPPASPRPPRITGGRRSVGGGTLPLPCQADLLLRDAHASQFYLSKSLKRPHSQSTTTPTIRTSNISFGRKILLRRPSRGQEKVPA